MKQKLLKTLGNNLLFVCVGLPTLTVGVYTTFLANDELAASATAIVKENQGSNGPAMPGIASAMFNYGNQTSLEDAYLLQSFLQSENFILQMNESLQLQQHFSAAGFPWVQRLSATADADDVYAYLLDRLSIQLSVDSSILTLQFRSFDPEFSTQVLAYVVEQAEAKINDLAQRMTDAHMSLARRELGRAERELKAANQALLTFQTKNAWLNESEVVAEFSQIETLRGRLLDSQIERQTLLRSMRPESSRIQTLDTGIEAMKAALAELHSALLTNDADSSIALANDFSTLSLELEFAQSKYAAATAAFQQAQLDAAQQHKFLLLISPVEAESRPVAPNPVQSTLTTLIVALLIFLVARLVILTIRDHTV